MRETDTAKTRRAMIDAADNLIAENGLKGTSVSSVARKLGMSHANVYRHFESRDALLEAVAQSWMTEMRAACEKAVSSQTTPDQKMTALVLAIRRQLFARARNAAALDLYDFVLRTMPGEAKAHHAHRFGLVSEIIGPTMDTTAVLDGLRCFIDPYLLHATEAPDTAERVKSLCNLLCQRLQDD